MNVSARSMLAVVFAVFMVVSPMATAASAAAATGSIPTERTVAPGSSGGPTTVAEEAPGPTEPSSGATTVAEETPGPTGGGAATPPPSHLGYGAPSGSEGTTGPEFTFGAPPVPPGSTPSAADDGGHHASSPPSIGETDRAAANGNLEELGETYSPDAAPATAHNLFTSEEQGTALTASLAESEAGSACPAGAPTRQFTVHAIQVDIVYNKYGQHDPNGVMYVLDENLDAVREQVANAPNASIDDPNPNATVEKVEPLTIRAHVGDCVEIDFVNHLDRHVSMHPQGVSYDPDDSDGSAVGFNNDSTAAPGEEVEYTWYVERTGAYMFSDRAQSVYHDDDQTLRQHGLFGALVVYEQDEQWLDPVTGEPVRSGTQVMIEDADGPDYRDFTVFYHDGADIVNADGSKPTWPHSDVEQSLYTMNYRGDPTGARLREDCPACDKEEYFYSSWVHGDPGGGDLVFPAYVGDPVTFHFVGAQVEEKHVNHNHGHRWKSEPGDAESATQDAQTISAGATYTRELVAGFGDGSVRQNMTYEEAFGAGGAGYVQGSPGDYIFHCHLFPHYGSGMWSILRVYDKDTRQMNQSAPGVMPLEPLPDRGDPPEPTAEDPGYPVFMQQAMDVGERPVRQPGLPGGREPTPLEESAINGSGHSDPIKPGAPYVDPCPRNASVRTYNITVFQTNVTYNNNGDYDDEARIYALDEDVEAIRNGEQRPRPLTIRAQQGECVEINLTNELPADAEPNGITMHVHFVGYDVTGSDGLTLGYNYDQGAEPADDPEARTGNITYRWYADEQGTIFWHDHQTGIQDGMHGVFGALIVEPPNSRWLNPRTGEPLDGGDGTRAMIVGEGFQNHREFVLFWQDFVPTHFPDGREVNGPHTHREDSGTMGVNYANAPLYHREHNDSAYAFSSWVHQDPQTPILRTYPDEPVKIRVLNGVFEESHNFMVNGIRWQQEPNDPDSPLVSHQSFGVSEQFVAEFDSPGANPQGIPVQDHLYGSFPNDDLWNGMWGFVRVFGKEYENLEPLPGYKPPDGTISEGRIHAINEEDDPPPQAPQPDDDRSNRQASCPDDAEVRHYDVVAFSTDITFNDYGDHDPYGIVFATKEDYQAIRNGTKEPEPLVLRAEQGECVEVNLINELPENVSQHDDHARVPVDEEDFDSSNRIGLHPSGLVDYSIQHSDGMTVGVGYDQTVAPGENITYRWFADEEVGTVTLTGGADVRNHRHHGAYGMLIVEPEGSTWLDPETGEQIETGTRAIVVPPDGEAFREYAVLLADGQYVVNPDGTCPVPPVLGRDGGDHPSAPCNQAHGEPEDQGFKAINYAAEPLPRRLDDDPREHLVFSSEVHGDPATPVFHANAGDRVVFRVSQPSDKPRGVTFELSGHLWPYQSTEGTQYVGVRGEITPGQSLDVIPLGGAGGPQQQPGDYYFGANKLRNYVEGGAWGIFRVHDGDAPVVDLDNASASGASVAPSRPPAGTTVDVAPGGPESVAPPAAPSASAARPGAAALPTVTD